jgi:hypothetical protein
MSRCDLWELAACHAVILPQRTAFSPCIPHLPYNSMYLDLLFSGFLIAFRAKIADTSKGRKCARYRALLIELLIARGAIYRAQLIIFITYTRHVKSSNICAQ